MVFQAFEINFIQVDFDSSTAVTTDPYRTFAKKNLR